MLLILYNLISNKKDHNPIYFFLHLKKLLESKKILNTITVKVFQLNKCLRHVEIFGDENKHFDFEKSDE